MADSLCLFFVLCLALSNAVEPKREWTILHYNEADDRVLETSLIDNVQEMLKSMTAISDYTFNLIVRFDGWNAQKPLSSNIGKVTEVVDLVVTHRNGLQVLDRLGELDMQDNDNMINFFVKYINNYPANNYMLIFSDHADALLGYGGDEHVPGGGYSQSILASTLERRLQVVLNKTSVPGNKFSLIGFDACLMGNIESLDIFSGVTKYVMASQWVEPARGWDYQALATITNSTAPVDLAEAIIRSYTAANAEMELAPSTLAVYDMSKVTGVVDALWKFVTSAGGISPAVIEDASIARDQIPCDTFANGPCDFGAFVDAFLKEVSDEADFNELVYNAYQLKAAIDDLIWFFMSGPEDDGTTGLAIWFPEESSQLSTRMAKYRTTFPHFVFWWDWLVVFVNTDIVPVEKEPRIGDISVSYDSLRNEVRFTATVTNPASILDAFLWISYLDPLGNTYGLLRLPADVVSRALDGASQEEAGSGDGRAIGQFYNSTRSSAGNATRGVIGNATRSAVGGNATRGVALTNGTRAFNGTRTSNFTRGTSSVANRTAAGAKSGFMEAFWDFSYYTWPGNLIQNWPWADVQYERFKDEFRTVEFNLESHKSSPVAEIDKCSVQTNWDVRNGTWALDSTHLYCEESTQGGYAEISIQNASMRAQIVGDLYPSIVLNQNDAIGAPLPWPLYVRRQPWDPSYTLLYHFTVSDLSRSSSQVGYTSSRQTIPTLAALLAQEGEGTPSTTPTPIPGPPVPTPVTPSKPTPSSPSVEPVPEEWISRGAFAGAIVGCVLGTFLVTACVAYVVLGKKRTEEGDGYYKL